MHKITIYLTSGDENHLLEKQEDIAFIENDDATDVTITIDKQNERQTIDGFGAAMSESSAYLISRLSEHQQHQVFGDLFTNAGIDISFIRTTIGASDFSLKSFTYNDIAEGQDLELKTFSIEEDLNYLIPVLKCWIPMKEVYSRLLLIPN